MYNAPMYITMYEYLKPMLLYCYNVVNILFLLFLVYLPIIVSFIIT